MPTIPLAIASPNLARNKGICVASYIASPATPFFVAFREPREICSGILRNRKLVPGIPPTKKAAVSPATSAGRSEANRCGSVSNPKFSATFSCISRTTPPETPAPINPVKPRKPYAAALTGNGAACVSIVNGLDAAIPAAKPAPPATPGAKLVAKLCAAAGARPTLSMPVSLEITSSVLYPASKALFMLKPVSLANLRAIASCASLVE